MKKSGFTLIEIIVAIAIFSIGITSISLGLITAVHTWKKADVKLQTMYYSQGMVEVCKGKDINTLKALALDPVNGSSCYAYFDDDYKNFMLYFLKNGADTRITNFSDPENQNNFIGWYNSGPPINSLVSIEDNIQSNIDSNLFSKCLSNNSANKRYGAYIMIKNSGNTVYLKVKVWDLQYGSDSASTREVFMR